MNHAHQSLVKYNNPLLVSTLRSDVHDKHTSGGSSTVGIHLPSNLTPTEDILNSILPPREWTDDGKLWVQYVSSTPATDSDVITLQEDLDKKLQQRQARETGIDPIREELYAQCFDELIRQVTINCAERGLLMLRVRDEIRMLVTAYQTLYESSIAFGMRKALHAAQTKTQMEAEIAQLTAECGDLEQQVAAVEAKTVSLEERDAVRCASDAQKHQEEVDMLKEHNASLRAELEAKLTLAGGGTAGSGGEGIFSSPAVANSNNNTTIAGGAISA